MHQVNQFVFNLLTLGKLLFCEFDFSFQILDQDFRVNFMSEAHAWFVKNVYNLLKFEAQWFLIWEIFGVINWGSGSVIWYPCVNSTVKNGVENVLVRLESAEMLSWLASFDTKFMNMDIFSPLIDAIHIIFQELNLL